MIKSLIFPQLVLFNDSGGSFDTYLDEVYRIFHSSFISSQPLYNGLKVSAQKHPEVDGMHRTFYHITHEGEDEGNRTPDIRRMERIRYPKFLIVSCPHDEIFIWEKTVGRDNRVHILNETERYLTVLTERKGFYLFWTAFYIEENHTIRKKKKEYDAYIKAKTAK